MTGDGVGGRFEFPEPPSGCVYVVTAAMRRRPLVGMRAVFVRPAAPLTLAELAQRGRPR